MSNLLLDSDYTGVEYDSASIADEPPPIPVFTTVASISQGGTGASTAAGARTSLGAAASGANADINTFSALTGNGGFANWTGTPDGTTHATYSGTASAGYVQAEIQGLMDKMKETTETLKKMIDALKTSGVLKT